MRPQPVVRAVRRAAARCGTTTPLPLFALPTTARVPHHPPPATPRCRSWPPASGTGGRCYSTPTAAATTTATARPPPDNTSTSSSTSPSTTPPSHSIPTLPASALAQALFASSGGAAAARPTTTADTTSTTSTTTGAGVNTAAAAASTNHPSVYATVLIYGRPYLVTPGDTLRLPFRMADVRPGDELRLDRVGVVGSRTVTAVGQKPQPQPQRQSQSGADSLLAPPASAPSLPPSTQIAAVDGNQAAAVVAHIPGASVRAVVLGLETEPLRVLVKKKRRTRRKRTVRSKHQFTVLRIQDVVLE
ncbi:hypothetical protein SPI_02230 [Niveomyces insectorum RCEF 264]|uniref:Large ribosomal subunit protein bL21m n=1 Tax=Niveomyces insectorum RCEF 264 TaxID=1081102 RepID=A0A167XV39_9HYPO|nr:hypothetical protein SPI_02230 [Niveomyces insectorum RCEF 264]